MLKNVPEIKLDDFKCFKINLSEILRDYAIKKFKIISKFNLNITD